MKINFGTGNKRSKMKRRDSVWALAVWTDGERGSIGVAER